MNWLALSLLAGALLLGAWALQRAKPRRLPGTDRSTAASRPEAPIVRSGITPVTSRRSRLQERLLFTIAAVGIYELGVHAPLPGVDRERLLEFLSISPGTLFGDYHQFLGGGLSKAAIFSLGIIPYVTASILVLLLSGAVPYLRRLRDGSPEANATFDRFIYATTIAIALFQGWGLALFLQVIPTPSGQPVVPDPGFVFRFQTVVIVATGAIFLAWMADQITRRGLVNGVALILLVDLVADAVSGLKTEIAALLHGDLLLRQAVVFLIVTGGLFALSLFMVRAEHRIPLQYAQEPARNGANGSWTPSIVLRMNSVGVLPVGIAGIAMLPLNYVGVTPGSVASWILYCGLILLFTYQWTAATFSGADVLARIRRYGFALADVDPATASGDHIDRIVERLVARHAAFLAGLVLIAPLVLARFGISSRLSWLAGPSLLVIAAIGVAILERVRVLRQRHGQTGQPAVTWVPVFEAETDLEVDLARGILERAGIPTARLSNRVIPVTGTLAFWEASRPPYPSLTIHRRLGDGRVYAEVSAEHVPQADSVLASYRSGLTSA